VFAAISLEFGFVVLCGVLVGTGLLLLTLREPDAGTLAEMSPEATALETSGSARD
jgi:hypothetical protein